MQVHLDFPEGEQRSSNQVYLLVLQVADNEVDEESSARTRKE